MTLLLFCTKVTLLTTPAPARLVVDVLYGSAVSHELFAFRGYYGFPASCLMSMSLLSLTSQGGLALSSL
jgi:hypothetical protein